LLLPYLCISLAVAVVDIMFRKPKKKPSALRNSGGDGGGDGGGAQQNKKKRPRQTRDSSSSDEDGSNHDDDDDAANNTTVLLEQIRQERNHDSKKKTKKTLLNTASTSSKKSTNMMHQYKSNSQEVQLSAQEMATRTAEYHPTDKPTTNDDMDNDNTDRSKNATLPSLQNQPRNKFLAGPLKATTFVRTTARFDYQPDICKDYKETGFCGFGDTCIYLHDRGDTKSGWQMEQEYEEKKRKEEERKGREMERFMNSMMCGEVGDGSAVKNKSADGGGDDDGFGGNNEEDRNAKSGIDDGIPYACHICRGPFQNPVVTTCGHYFCESCMQSRIREAGSDSTACPICQKDTHGVLNHPQKLVAKKRRLVGRDGTWEEYLAKK
jgi:RING finger protein 113A